MDRNQRRFPRVDFYEPVQYRRVENEVSQGWAACDLSEGGLRVRSEEFIPLEEKVALELALDFGRVLNLKGRVVWIQKVPHAENYQMGLQFEETSLDRAGHAQLRSYILERGAR